MFSFHRKRHAVNTDPSRDARFLAYEMLTLRQLDHDSLMWQAPSLALAAQAFIFTITFSPDVPAVSRIATAVAGTVILLMAMQLMAKHRHLGQLELNRLAELEAELGLPATVRHAWVRFDAPMDERKPDPWWVRLSSYRLWVLGLWILVLVNLGAIGATVIDLVGSL